MTSIASVTGGVDTHLDVHVAAALDERGGLLGTGSFATTPAGYRALVAWLRGFGPVALVGVEGTGSYGVGLARHLRAESIAIVEIDRPNRAKRRQKGKSDTLDAIWAARAAHSGDATGQAKTRDGNVEGIRVLRVARVSAQKARTQALNQLRSLVSTAPDELRGRLRDLSIAELTATTAAMRPGTTLGMDTATKMAMRSLGRRVRALDAEVADLDAMLEPLVAVTAPKLLAHYGVGSETAAALLVAAGDNPDRIRSEATFARLCGAAPIPATSGKTQNRHRLHRGGDRQANSALWHIALTRMSSDPRTRAYVVRRTDEGLTKRDVMRCLKRYIARELFVDLPDVLVA
jgi:transposase